MRRGNRDNFTNFPTKTFTLAFIYKDQNLCMLLGCLYKCTERAIIALAWGQGWCGLAAVSAKFKVLR